MAEIVSVVGVPHFPFHHHLISGPPSEWSPDTKRMEELGRIMRAKVAASRPDTLLVVGSDHAHQLFLDNMPQFLLGKMEAYDAIFANETREFGIQPCVLPGDIELAGALLDGGVQAGVDFSFSNELKVDHSIVTPLHFIRAEHDLPIVPLMTNCVAPPMPTSRRLFEVGRIIREVLEASPVQRRVAVVVSGHMSIEVGGPRHFLDGPTDEEFDDTVVARIAEDDAEGLIDFCTFERMTQAGNATYQFANFILAMGVKGDFACTYAEGMKRRGTTQAWFAWEAQERA